VRVYTPNTPTLLFPPISLSPPILPSAISSGDSRSLLVMTRHARMAVLFPWSPMCTPYDCFVNPLHAQAFIPVPAPDLLDRLYFGFPRSSSYELMRACRQRPDFPSRSPLGYGTVGSFSPGPTPFRQTRCSTVLPMPNCGEFPPVPNDY